MSATSRKSTRTWKRFWGPLLFSVLIGLGISAILLALREAGYLQRLELRVYDRMLAQRPADLRAADSIVVVGVDEEDIHLLGYPLTDAQLATALNVIASYQPRAIGVDLLRDIEVGSGRRQLNDTIDKHRMIVFGEVFGADVEEALPRYNSPAPLRIRSSRTRSGMVDFPLGPDGIARRAFLYDRAPERSPIQWQTFAYGFTTLLANRFLEAEGILKPPSGGQYVQQFWIPLMRRFEPHDGAFRNAPDRGHQFLLDYAAKHSFKRYSLRQVAPQLITAAATQPSTLPALPPPVRPPDIAGKVVLFGNTAESIKDEFQVPMQERRYGVEVHADALDQLIRAARYGPNVIGTWSERGERWWIAGCCLGGTLLSFLFRRRQALFILSMFIGGLLIVASAWIFFERNVWIPLIPPAGGWVLSGLFVSLYLFSRENAERQVVTQLFSRMVSKDVVNVVLERRDELLEEGRLRPQKVFTTVLFSDLKGFTSASEKMDPADLVEWLNDYMQAMTDIVSRHDGVVAKYIGDGLMVVFRVPFPGEGEAGERRDAANAVNAALEMRKVLGQMRQDWEAAGKPSPGMRIGIYSGVVVIGSLGSRERLEFTTLGDTVNTASRLESFNKELMDEDIAAGEVRILIGESTFRKVEGLFKMRYIGQMELTGRREPVGIYGVIGQADGQESHI